MVEYNLQLDSIFNALSDGTRRDILSRVSKHELSVGEIARHYSLTFAAISKHLKVLEKAKLIVKRKAGKEQLVLVNPKVIQSTAEYLERYEDMWNGKLDRLGTLLSKKKNT